MSKKRGKKLSEKENDEKNIETYLTDKEINQGRVT